LGERWARPWHTSDPPPVGTRHRATLLSGRRWGRGDRRWRRSWSPTVLHGRLLPQDQV